MKRVLSLGGMAGLSLGAMLGIFVPVGVAQDPPAQTFQPGPWQPVARIDPTQPVQVQIINQSGSVLVYGLTDPNAVEQEVPATQIAQTQIGTYPSFLTINTIERSALRYDLRVTDNQIQVQVQRINDVVGDRTLNIDDTGAIYIY